LFPILVGHLATDTAVSVHVLEDELAARRVRDPAPGCRSWAGMHPGPVSPVWRGRWLAGGGVAVGPGQDHRTDASPPCFMSQRFSRARGMECVILFAGW